jgi:hypothetical protein
MGQDFRLGPFKKNNLQPPSFLEAETLNELRSIIPNYPYRFNILAISEVYEGIKFQC